ncbi:MAG TPA: hypothetical protein VIK01_26300 [Polyangiaceae bacterium]
MFNLRQAFAFWAVAAFVIGLAGEVHAQATGAGVTLPTTGITRRADRGGNLMNNQINFDDCNIDEKIQFSVAISQPNNSWTLQVWAGANCDQLSNRVTPTVLNCHLVGSLAVSAASPPPISVSVRDLLYVRTQASAGVSPTVAASTAGTGGDGTAGTDSTAGGGGTAGTGGSAGSAGAATATLTADQAACTPQDPATGAQTINVYFMMVDGSSAIQGTFATWAATYKLLAPLPPDKVTGGIGETIIPIHFSYNTTSSDTSINGYNFYCDPPAGKDAAADAGVLPVDGGIAVTACNGIASTVLVAGKQVTDLGANKCGSAGKSAQGGNATGLINGVAYNVAVATTDSYNNVGVLSKPTCAVPQPVTGFYEAYTDAGGKGGGGFCSFSRHREPLALAALLGFASCLLLRRRRAA